MQSRKCWVKFRFINTLKKLETSKSVSLFQEAKEPISWSTFDYTTYTIATLARYYQLYLLLFGIQLIQLRLSFQKRKL